MRVAKSRNLFARACRILPGGVDSPVRAFKAVGGGPLFIRRASGSTIEDVDGNTFIDYVMSWGPLIHGHAPRGLIKALAAAAKNGTSFGAPSPLEGVLGRTSFDQSFSGRTLRMSGQRHGMKDTVGLAAPWCLSKREYG